MSKKMVIVGHGDEAPISCSSPLRIIRIARLIFPLSERESMVLARVRFLSLVISLAGLSRPYCKR